MDKLIAPLPDHPFEGAVCAQQIAAGEHHCRDAQLPGLLGKGTVHKTDHGHVDGLGEILKQGVHMGLGAAAVAAADEVDDFHGMRPSR